MILIQLYDAVEVICSFLAFLAFPLALLVLLEMFGVRSLVENFLVDRWDLWRQRFVRGGKESMQYPSIEKIRELGESYSRERFVNGFCFRCHLMGYAHIYVTVSLPVGSLVGPSRSSSFSFLDIQTGQFKAFLSMFGSMCGYR